MRTLVTSSRRLPVTAVLLGVIGLVLMAAPVSADTGSLSVGTSTIAPGGTTTITASFASTGTSVSSLTVTVVPQAGATGKITLSDPVTTKTPNPDPTVGWNCAINLSDSSIVECLWNGAGKTNVNTATVTVTATASADANGSFQVVAQDETPLDPIVLDTEPLAVATPTPPTTTTPPSDNTAAQSVSAQPSFTG